MAYTAPELHCRAMLRLAEEEAAESFPALRAIPLHCGDATIFASIRLVSFSPPGPVSTVLVTSKPVTPSAGPFTINSTRAPGGRRDMVLRVY